MLRNDGYDKLRSNQTFPQRDSPNPEKDVRFLEDAKLLGLCHDRGMRVIHAHQALAATAGQVIDQDPIRICERRLACDLRMATHSCCQNATGWQWN